MDAGDTDASLWFGPAGAAVAVSAVLAALADVEQKLRFCRSLLWFIPERIEGLGRYNSHLPLYQAAATSLAALSADEWATLKAGTRSRLQERPTGIGERAAPIREAVCRQAAWLGLALDEKINREAPALPDGQQLRISTADSAVAAWVVPTDEERMIARHTRRLALGH